MNINTDSDILQVQGVNSKGFGIVPKIVMQDQRLSIQAKAIYSYFCSYAGAGKTAFPQRDKIIQDLCISEDTYYRHFKQLKALGYIKAEQGKDENGKFTRNIFTLIDSVPKNTESRKKKNTNVPCPKFADTEEIFISPCPKKQGTEKPCTENKGTNNNNNIKSTVSKNNSPSSPSETTDRQGQTDIDGYIKLIHANIQYEDLKVTNHDDIALIDEIVLIMLDAIMSTSTTVRIDDEVKPREIVKHYLLRITSEDIKHVLRQFKSRTEPIKKKRRYLLSTLYNSKTELVAHQTNVANQEKAVEHPVVAKPTKQEPPKPNTKNKFNDYPQREHSKEYYEELEKHLLNRK